jgi:hypothetical protein
VLKQISFLENSINKQEALTRKYFEEMDYIEEHYKRALRELKDKHRARKDQIVEKMVKQSARNTTMELNNLDIVSEIGNAAVR